MVEPSSRKRVRTGCLTCRKRRRKCDERKPDCDNCIGKGLSCQYGTRVTFVPSKLQVDLASGTKSTTPPTPLATRATNRTVPLAHTSDTDTQYQESQLNNTGNDSPLVGLGRFDFNPEPERNPDDGQGPTFQALSSIGHSSSVTTQSSESHSTHDRPLEVPKGAANGKTGRQRYELELFVHYCYNIAPILDLGLGSLSFGVQATLDSTVLENTYHAILALASSHRALLGSSSQAVDQATGVTSAYLAQLPTGETDWNSFSTSRILLLWRSVLVTPIESWSSLAPDILSQVNQGTHLLEHWHALLRLHLAVSLTQATNHNDIKLMPPPHATIDGKDYEHLRHSSAALWLLEQIRSSYTRASALPHAQTWLAQWQDLQRWLLARPEDMHPLLDLGEDEISKLQLGQNLNFPCIAFSHAAAAIANVAHHLASMMLLRNKPRLVKPVAVSISSTSLLWHAQRVLGIVTTAADAQMWDPFLVAALLYAARLLSHDEQRLAVSETLRTIETIAGLNLQSAIRDIAPVSTSRSLGLG